MTNDKHEGMPADILAAWPRFEDGGTVRFGDTVEDDCGHGYFEVNRVSIDSNGAVWLVNNPNGDVTTRYCVLQPGQKAKRPDSWERLDADVEKGSCDYFGKVFDGTNIVTCDGCTASEGDIDCYLAVERDIVRRAKMLAGVL